MEQLARQSERESRRGWRREWISGGGCLERWLGGFGERDSSGNVLSRPRVCPKFWVAANCPFGVLERCEMPAAAVVAAGCCCLVRSATLLPLRVGRSALLARRLLRRCPVLLAANVHPE